MFAKMRIQEHMEVADSAGQHVGTVDEVDGDNIKLTGSDSDTGTHRFVPIDAVDRIDDNRVYLKSDAAIPGQTMQGEVDGQGSTSTY
jgi:hypothetical protein